MKQYNIRLDQQMVNQLDMLEGCRSGHIRKAIGVYLQNDTPPVYNVDLVDLLKNQILDLKQDKQFFKSQITALTIARLPLLSRVIQRLRNPE